MKHKLQVLSRAIIGDAHRLLMCWEKKEGFYFLPGETLEPGENLKACLRREFQEEMSLNAAVGPFLGCIENNWDHDTHNYQELNFIFRVQPPSDFLDQPIITNETHISSEVLPIKQLLTLPNVLPTQLKSFIKDCLPQKPYALHYY